MPTGPREARPDDRLRIEPGNPWDLRHIAILRVRPAALGGFPVNARSATLNRCWAFNSSVRLQIYAALQGRKKKPLD
jgi:hypothetical protein